MTTCNTSRLSHKCIEWDFDLFQGAYWQSEPIVFVNPDGTYADLTGCTFRGQARRDKGPTTAVSYSYTFTLYTTTDPTKHSVTVSLSATALDSLTLGKTKRDKDSIFYFDWEIVDASLRPHRFVMGRNFVDRNVTR